MNNNTTFAVLAIVSALGLLGVVGVTLWFDAAEAVKPPFAGQPGCKTSQAVNASKDRCIK